MLGEKKLDELKFERLHSGGMAVLRHGQNHAVILLGSARGNGLMPMRAIVRVFVRFNVSGVGFVRSRKLLEKVMDAMRRRNSQKDQQHCGCAEAKRSVQLRYLRTPVH